MRGGGMTMTKKPAMKMRNGGKVAMKKMRGGGAVGMKKKMMRKGGSVRAK